MDPIEKFVDSLNRGLVIINGEVIFTKWVRGEFDQNVLVWERTNKPASDDLIAARATVTG